MRDSGYGLLLVNASIQVFNEVIVKDNPEIIYIIYDDHIYQERSAGTRVKICFKIVNDSLHEIVSGISSRNF